MIPNLAEATADESRDALFAVSLDRVVLLWSEGAQTLLGFDATEAVGRPVEETIVPEQGVGEMRRQLAKIADGEGILGTQTVLRHKDGTPVEVSLFMYAARGAAGQVAKIVVRASRRANGGTEHSRSELEELYRNQHELEEDNRRIQEASRLKSEFLANMSHELRTPLNAIIGFAELMYKGKVGPVSENHREYLGDILNSSRHLLQLINDVLDLAKVESGRMDLHPEATQLLALVTEVRDILRGFASSKGISVGIEVDPTVSSAVVDPGKLKQVLYNYLSNALKFTPDGGHVSVRVMPDSDGYFRAEVEDTGIGIGPEDLERLFVEFQQLDSGMAKKYAGTGLGLALTKRMVELQGGHVGVRSQPGTGSVFWAVLPTTPSETFLPAPPPAVVARPPSRTLPPTANRLLVVDDDPSACRLMQAAFEPLGITVTCAPTPTDAIRAVEERTPAVVVLDVLLPEMSGYELLERLRTIPEMQSVPIILWTIKDISESMRHRVHALAQGIVFKGHGGVDPLVATLKPFLAPTRAGGSDGE